METTKPRSRLRAYIILGLILLVFFGGLTVFAIVFWKDIMAVMGSTEALQTWLAQFGVWAPIAYIGIQITQIVIFVLPGEVAQVAAGYFFGILPGTLYAIIGLIIGTAICFLTTRKLGISFVTKLFGQEEVQKFEGYISTPKATAVFFLLYLIPGLPKDFLGFVGGLTTMRLGFFLVLSIGGRLPSLLVSIIAGNAMSGQNWTLVIVLVSVACLFFGLGVIYRKAIYQLLETKVLHRSGQVSIVADQLQPAITADTTEVEKK